MEGKGEECDEVPAWLTDRVMRVLMGEKGMGIARAGNRAGNIQRLQKWFRMRTHPRVEEFVPGETCVCVPASNERNKDDIRTLYRNGKTPQCGVCNAIPAAAVDSRTSENVGGAAV